MVLKPDGVLFFHVWRRRRKETSINVWDVTTFFVQSAQLKVKAKKK